MSVKDLIRRAKEEGIVLNYVQVRRGGQITEDWGRLSSKTRLNTWSASKSFISVAVGIAMDESLMSLDDRLCEAFPEYLPEQPQESLLTLTVRDMLTMTTGLAGPLFFGDDPERYQTQDWISYFFAQDFPHPNGERFLYSNFNTYMLACMVERRAGMPFMEFARPRLLEPIGILSADWTTCPCGHVHAANGLYITIDELANFGQMVLQDGTFLGRRVVSQEYLREATRNQMPAAETRVKYGYQFWLPEDESYFYASGKFGQYCIVLPDKDAVIAVQSLDSREHDILPLVEEFVIAEL